MVSTRKKKQSNRKLLSQLDDFDQDVVIGEAASNGQQSVRVNNDTADRDFTANDGGSNSTANENPVNIQILEKSSNEEIDRELVKIVDTIEDRIQNAF